MFWSAEQVEVRAWAPFHVVGGPERVRGQPFVGRGGREVAAQRALVGDGLTMLAESGRSTVKTSHTEEIDSRTCNIEGGLFVKERDLKPLILVDFQ